MKKSLKLSVAVALALSSTAVYATNGVNLIGTSAKSRAMGGVGIGMPFGADSGLPNPALISSVENYEVSFGGTLFMPDVSTTGLNEMTKTDSEADTFIVPEVGFAMKATDNFYWGVGMWGASGLGVDYRNDDTPADGTAQMVTNYQILQLVVPLTYKTGGLSLSVAPVLNYGALDSNWDDGSGGLGPFGTQGAGVSQDLSWGANLGVAYQTGGLTVGAVYKSEIEMKYEGQPALDTSGPAGTFIPDLVADRLDVPAEYGIGASYVFGKHTIAADYKVIAYGDTTNWEQFGWDNQDVIALGYQFDAGKWALRAGYNYGKSPVQNQTEVMAMPPTPSVQNFFNSVGFPATVEQHFTVGGTWNFNKTLGVDLAFTYAPEVDETFDVSLLGGSPEVETSHSQTALTAGLTLKF
jgi:long-chain fatty acid transport protein